MEEPCGMEWLLVFVVLWLRGWDQAALAGCEERDRRGAGSVSITSTEKHGVM